MFCDVPDVQKSQELKIQQFGKYKKWNDTVFTEMYKKIFGHENCIARITTFTHVAFDLCLQFAQRCSTVSNTITITNVRFDKCQWWE